MKDESLRPQCCGQPMVKNGFQESGSQRYRCKVCGRKVTDSWRKPGGKQLIEGIKLNRTQYNRRYRAKARKKPVL